MDGKTHWNKVYADKTAGRVTWYQANPLQSLAMIAATSMPADGAIIDIGGGLSFLAGNLLDAGYQEVTVLDISGNALRGSKDRLGEAANDVTWLEADITEVRLPEVHYALWHDRAVFHFLTDAQDQQSYVTAVRRSLQPGGHIILATFAIDGPQRCSGLDIKRYGEQEIMAAFGDGFRLISSVDELHHTPWDTTQKFTYFHLTKENRMLEHATAKRWSLQDLLPDPVEESLEAALADLENKVTALEAQRSSLTEDIATDTFFELLHEYEAIADLMGRCGAYGELLFSEDTQNKDALNIRDRIRAALIEAGNRILFFSLWLKEMPDETAERLIAAGDEFRYFLETERKFKPHTLKESEEQIINLKDANGIEAMMTLYEMVTSKFTYSLEVDGQTRTLTRDQLSAYYRHPSPAVRAATYQELFGVYAENSTLLAQMYNHRVRDWQNEGGLRKYEQPISSRNLANDLPDGVVDTLLDVCRHNSDVFQRYFRLKAGWIGMDKLRRYDVYAPLAASDKEFAYGDAVEIVLDSFEHFSPQVAQLAARVFTADHIDAEIRPDKRGGAFCYSVSPTLTPWVFLNYSGKARDVATMAHELGHAIHGMLAADKSPLTFHSSLPLAETASVFAEMMLTDRLLKEESDPAVRRDLLAGAIDDAYATIQRQAFFTIFEKDAHRMISGGETVDAVSAAYMDNLRQQFGDSMELSEEFQWEWISIPHFYRVPFYTYAYSFGQLLVLALYRQYQQEGDPFIPRYLKLLSYGGSEAPVKVLQEAGFDIASPEFWQGGYDVLSGMISTLEEL